MPKYPEVVVELVGRERTMKIDGYGFKFLDPTGCTYYNDQKFQYPLPHDNDWGPWITHPNPANPDGNDCGPGRLHVMKKLDARYAPDNWWPWAAQYSGLVEESEEKLGVRSLRLRRLSPKLFAAIVSATGRRADLRRANLRGADLRRANLRGADLREADLRGANLWEANLREVNLRRANLRGADLRRANLRGANLWEANLREADLRGANLWEANLREADLREADLRRADLRRANLWEVNLRRANLWGADLEGAIQ